jgi:hypothetical protein
MQLHRACVVVNCVLLAVACLGCGEPGGGRDNCPTKHEVEAKKGGLNKFDFIVP